VLYFAGARDAAGVAEETCELPEGVTTVRGFMRFIGGRHPEIDARKDSIRVARNERFAEDDEPIADGDVLALIPPVAGG
jgi:molybdopterin converting factor subunit 1